MVCPLPADPTSTIAFHLVGTEGYPRSPGATPSLAVAADGPSTTSASTSATRTCWHTPLKDFIGLGGNGYTVDKANAMRMEPIL